MPLSEETFGANCCQPRAHLRPHSERIIPSVTVDMSMTRRQVSTTSKAGTITPKSAGSFPPMSSSPQARAFSGITHMRIAGITLPAALTPKVIYGIHCLTLYHYV